MGLLQPLGFGGQFGVAGDVVFLTCGKFALEISQGLLGALPCGEGLCGGRFGLLVGVLKRGDAGFEIFDCGC